MILHSLDGYDEVSLTGSFKAITNRTELLLNPEQLGLHTHTPEALAGGKTVDESARIFMNVLNDEAEVAQKEAVIANAGHGLVCRQQSTDSRGSHRYGTGVFRK